MNMMCMREKNTKIDLMKPSKNTPFGCRPIPPSII